MRNKILNALSTRVLTILLLIPLSAMNIAAAPGDLDSTFGTGGKVYNALPGDNQAQGIRIQPDGKIVALYFTLTLPSIFYYIVRYNPDGSLDTSFGTNGTVNSPSTMWFLSSLAILPDGKILISGTGGNGNFAVFRLNINGSLDYSFGTNGYAFTYFNDITAYEPALRVQPDGKIVVFGYLFHCFDENCYNGGVGAARFNSDGSVDNSFGTNGNLRITNPANEFVYSSGFVILPDGKLLLKVSLSDFDSIALIRVNANGTLDTAFGLNGILILELENQLTNFVSGMALQTDAKIVFTSNNYSKGEILSSTIFRLNPDGSFDASFGTNGKVVIPISHGTFGGSIVIQPTGKILAASKTTGGAAPFDFAIVRLNSDGSRDTTFGASGTVTTQIGSYDNVVTSLALQPDGKLVAYGGVRNSPTADWDIGLARYVLESPRPTQFDFDGDGKSDVSVFRPTNGAWYINRSPLGFSATQFGLSTDKLAPADFDGDGKADLAVMRPSSGIWYILNSSNSTVTSLQFGAAEDLPLPADFDGDGKADISVFRPSIGTWFRFNSTNNQFVSVQFGTAGDHPQPADFDGDGKADINVFRPSTGAWYRLNSSSGAFFAVQFGVSTDIPTSADYDGDGKADVSVFRSGNGVWYRINSNGGAIAQTQFGQSGDQPTPADYDGDGKTDMAVYRDGTWYLQQSTNGFAAQPFGSANDKPVQSTYQP